jgi:hypothetical protein
VTDSPWSSSKSSSRRTRRGAGRLIEIITVVLLAAATVGSAWSAYQVARWNGIETDGARASAALRLEASQAYLLATQIVAYDASAIAQYSQAVAEDSPELQAFLLETLVRPGFRPVLERWREQYEAGETPTNLLEDQEYLGELFADSQDLDAQALAATQRSEDAAANADGYVQLTLFFAASLFFAGITASFRTRLPKLLLLTAAGVTIGVAGMLLAGYPVA